MLQWLKAIEKDLNVPMFRLLSQAFFNVRRVSISWDVFVRLLLGVLWVKYWISDFLHSLNIVYNLVTRSHGNRLQYYVLTQVGEPDSFWRHGKLTHAKIHSTAMMACTFPKSTEPWLYWTKTYLLIYSVFISNYVILNKLVTLLYFYYPWRRLVQVAETLGH